MIVSTATIATGSGGCACTGHLTVKATQIICYIYTLSWRLDAVCMHTPLRVVTSRDRCGKRKCGRDAAKQITNHIVTKCSLKRNLPGARLSVLVMVTCSAPLPTPVAALTAPIVALDAALSGPRGRHIVAAVRAFLTTGPERVACSVDADLHRPSMACEAPTSPHASGPAPLWRGHGAICIDPWGE